MSALHNNSQLLSSLLGGGPPLIPTAGPLIFALGGNLVAPR